jgi:hypothetical protein
MWFPRRRPAVLMLESAAAHPNNSTPQVTFRTTSLKPALSSVGSLLVSSCSTTCGTTTPASSRTTATSSRVLSTAPVFWPSLFCPLRSLVLVGLVCRFLHGGGTTRKGTMTCVLRLILRSSGLHLINVSQANITSEGRWLVWLPFSPVELLLLLSHKL